MNDIHGDLDHTCSILTLPDLGYFQNPMAEVGPSRHELIQTLVSLEISGENILIFYVFIDQTISNIKKCKNGLTDNAAILEDVIINVMYIISTSCIICV